MKERTISIRISAETESKLNFIMSNYEDLNISSAVELAIHNEWASQNYANLMILEETKIDPNYKKIVDDRICSQNTELTNR